MASCFSHPAVPLALACWLPEMRRPSILIIASLLSAAPDLDAIGWFLGVPYESQCGHRGFTHSLAFAALVGLVAGCLLSRRAAVPWWRLAPFLAVATASHGLVDMATDGGHGIALLWPFSADRLFWPCRPIMVAPLGVRAFFSEYGLMVLASEAVWLWLPAVAVGTIGLVMRRAAPARGS